MVLNCSFLAVEVFKLKSGKEKKKKTKKFPRVLLRSEVVRLEYAGLLKIRRKNTALTMKGGN